MSCSWKKIGIFGGSFNPIHKGHLQLAKSLKKTEELDEIWLIPAFISPFKQKKPPISCRHRIKMCELAISGMEGFKVLDIECRKKEVSYTVNTVLQLKEKHPDYKFFLLLGKDAALTLPSWHKADLLLKNASLLIGPRFFMASSSEIRELIMKNKPVSHFIDPKVQAYIKQHKLYLSDEKSDS